MKNAEQITPEEQIRNQREEIASQRRRIESLEAELQRYMENPPNKGKYTYDFTPAPRGEDALLRQITALQKQLDDCMDNSKIVHDAGLYDRLFNIVAAVFIPRGEEEQYQDENWEIWFYFRQALLKSPECSDFFSHKTFRDVIASMSLFIDDLNQSSTTKTNRFQLFKCSAENLLASPNADGWQLAIEALDILATLPDGSENILDQTTIQNLRLSMQIIRKCAVFAEAADRDIQKESAEN